jgi:hypothetical protein
VENIFKDREKTMKSRMKTAWQILREIDRKKADKILQDADNLAEGNSVVMHYVDLAPPLNASDIKYIKLVSQATKEALMEIAKEKGVEPVINTMADFDLVKIRIRHGRVWWG